MIKYRIMIIVGLERPRYGVRPSLPIIDLSRSRKNYQVRAATERSETSESGSSKGRLRRSRPLSRDLAADLILIEGCAKS